MASSDRLWHLAEAGHEVTVVTRHPVIGVELARTAADVPLRMRLKRLGVKEVGDSAITGWHGDAAVHAIGDCVAPRLAVMAIYEGRRLAMSL